MAEAVEAAAAVRVVADAERVAEAETGPVKLRAVPAPMAVLDVEYLLALGVEVADAALDRKGNPHFRRARRAFRRRGGGCRRDPRGGREGEIQALHAAFLARGR